MRVSTLSSLRRLTTRALRHMDVLELALRSALAHTATVARVTISHQQLAYQKFRTWAAVTPAKQWRPVTVATYMAASNLMQTAQSLIRGIV